MKVLHPLFWGQNRVYSRVLCCCFPGSSLECCLELLVSGRGGKVNQNFLKKSPKFAVQTDPVVTDFFYKEFKQKKLGPKLSLWLKRVSVRRGSVRAKLYCMVFCKSPK